MDEVVTLFRKCGWRDCGKVESREHGYDKPLFQSGRWKALIGKTWVTLYELLGDQCIGAMDSFRVDDVRALRIEIDKRS